MEKKILKKINEAKQMFEKYECGLQRYKKQSGKSWNEINLKSIRQVICDSCILSQADVDIYDTNDKDVKVNICTLLDVMDYLEES